MSTRPLDSLELPAPVARFFAHQTADPEAVARCFSEDAIVRDEQHEHRGRSAIAAWNADVVRKYQFRSEPLTAETTGTETTVAARMTGNFAGSPVELRLRFTLAVDLITRLEIAP